MLPVSGAGIGAIEFPQLPPVPSGPNPTAPGATPFGRMYDRLLTPLEQTGSRGLPTAMEVAPLLAPAQSLAEPFKPSVEFPGAVDPDGLALPRAGLAAPTHPDAGRSMTQFLDPFKQGLQQVNQLAANSERLSNEAAFGGDVDLHDVMIASEKAGVAMQLTLQVRNKLVEAYQEVMRMQV